MTDLAAAEPDRARGPGVFAGESEMAARCRALDWAATPLGPVDKWSPALRIAARALLDAPFPICLWAGPEYALVYNDGYRRILAAKHPAALGQSGARVWAEIWEELAPQFAGVRAGGPAVHAENARFAMARLEGGGTEDAWFSYSLSALRDDDGEVVAVLNISPETTARVLAERRLHVQAAELQAERERAAGILEATADAYFALDADYRIIAANAAMERGSGLPRAQLLGRVFWDLFPGAVGTAFEAHFRAAVVDRREAHFTHDYSDGRLELVVEEDVYPAAGGGMAAFWRDITSRVRADAERARLLADAVAARAEAESARSAAETANRAKAEFLATMSHELRTPLNAIGGYAELLELGIHGPVTADQRSDLARIQTSQRHLLGLINGVLNYARIEAGAVHYALADVPLAEVLATCEALVAPQARAKGLALHHAPCDAALRVTADREKLQQVVLNLLSNAVKFTEPGGRVDLRCAAGAASDGVGVEVADTGIGIAADQLAHVFEPFVQVDQRLTRAQEGTGLGLAISRDLARGMGGDLTAESTPGVGSTFTLALPRA